MAGLSSRDSNGVIVANSTTFPDGIKWVTDFTHSLGLKQGVYSDRGTNTCSGSAPGSYGYEYLDAMTYAQWGADYLKEDNCKVVPGSTALVDYGKMSDGLMKSGRPITFCICGNGGNTQSKGFVSWHPSLGNQWRTTGDIGDNYASMISHLDPNSTTAYLAGPGRWNDPDMLEVGRGGMTDVEDQTHFTMWCIMAAPLIMGNNLTTMTPAALATLTNPEAIAVDQDPAGEEGVKVVNHVSSTMTNEVWSRTLGYDFSTKAVVLFNRNGAATNITVNWTDIGLQAGTATVRDLWAHADLGTFTNSFTTNVPSHAAVLLKIVGTPPVLPGLGTNYLSDLQAVYAYTGSGTIVKDKSIGGNTITLAGLTYPKGIGVNSRAGVNYDLGGVCSRFQTTVGMDDEVGSSGSVIFQVFADGMEIYNSGVMTGSSPSQTVNLDVTGVRRLILGVNDADNGTSSDHGDWANALVIVTNTTPQPPHAPTGLTASPGNQIGLTWIPTLAATGYNVKRATHSGGTYTTLTNVPIATFTDTNVASDTTYYYVVSAVNSIGESSNSVPVSSATCNVPAMPTNLVTTVSNSQVTINWQASSGATSYTISRFTGSTPPAIIASGITTTNFTDASVVSGTTYYYLVAAANDCNQSGYSFYVAAIVPPGPPATPTGLSATPGNSQVNLSWNTASGATGYNLKRSTTNGGPYDIIGTNVSGAAYLDTAVANGTTYYYVVSALNAGGESSNSSQVSVTPIAPITAFWTNTATASAQNWNVNANWTNALVFPNTGGELTVVNANIAAPQTINLNQAITIGSLEIGDANNSASYTIAANGGSLTFSDTNTVSLTQLSTSKGDILATPISITTNLVIINNSTNPLTFAGDVSASGGSTLTIGSGALQVGDGTTNGSLGSVNVADNASLVFNRSNNVVMSGVISGSGSVAQNGTGILTLSATNTYTGSTLINAGTLALNAVPAGTQSIYVTNGAIFQLNANYKTLTLTGDGTWNVNANNGSGTAVSYSTSENVSAFTGTVNVLYGTRYWLGTQNSMPAGTMYVANGGQLGISYNGLLTGNLHIAGASWGGTGGENDGALRLNSGTGSGGNFAGTLTLDADAGIAAGQTGGTGTVSANISGAHTLTIVNGTITLSGNNDFGALNVPSGSTAVAGSATAFGGGALIVNGTAQLNGFALSVSNVSGTGTVSGDATMNGILAPGTNSIGILTFANNLTLNGGSTTVMELNKSLLTNDVVQVAGTLTYGGTLMLTNLSGTLTNGDSFKLFNAGVYSGAFTNIVPAIPGVNLAWNTNNLNSGILSIVASPTAPPKFGSMAANGSNFIFNGTNGVPGWPYYVLASTNVSLAVDELDDGFDQRL